MKYENNFYLTHDCSLDIEFLFVDLGGTVGWRAYILTDIDYKGRNTSSGIIHRLTENSEDMLSKIRWFMNKTRPVTNPDAPVYYICWSAPISELDDIRNISQVWSEITAYYIKHGGDFSAIQSKLKSRDII